MGERVFVCQGASKQTKGCATLLIIDGQIQIVLLPVGQLCSIGLLYEQIINKAVSAADPCLP